LKVPLEREGFSDEGITIVESFEIRKIVFAVAIWGERCVKHKLLERGGEDVEVNVNIVICPEFEGLEDRKSSTKRV
jgi:hypothetical protein